MECPFENQLGEQWQQKPFCHSISFPPKIGGSLGILILQLLLLLQINERSLFQKHSLCKRDQPTNQSKPTKQTNNQNKTKHNYLVVEPTHLKTYATVKLDPSSPRIGVKNKNFFELPPTRKHQTQPSTWMFPKIVGFPPESSILIGFSIIFTIHFWVPLFLETPTFHQISTLRIPSSASCN